MTFDLADLDIQPKPGMLLPLKTKGEVRSSFEKVEVYVLPISARFANAILRVLGDIIPDIRSTDLQHLRRVANSEFLPARLIERFCLHHEVTCDSENSPQAGYLGTSGCAKGSHTTDSATNGSDTRYLLVSPSALISHAALKEALAKYPPYCGSQQPIRLYVIEVPALPPTSATQAQEWSSYYWPTMYKNTNPFGPHPSIVSRAEAEIAPIAGKCLALAERVALETSSLGLGVCSGCVIVDQTAGTPDQAKIVAVAGDARWCGPLQRDHRKDSPGNVAAHAVMRAIGMVARKRLDIARTLGEATNLRQSQSNYRDEETINNSLIVLPRTPLEVCTSILTGVDPNGYLCTDLDIYITHEPCVMCSMAILHSRFRRCVFKKRVNGTGGLVSDTGLQHGIFWRPSELNWKMLAWEWIDDVQDEHLSQQSNDIQFF